jgi:hypothetical protein
MIKLDASYSEYYEANDPNYPAGKGVDASSEESFDGTPYKKEWMNDQHGWRQAIFRKAFASVGGLSGYPDNVNQSDTLNAILKCIQDAIIGQYFIKYITGPETVFSFEDFNINYNEEKTYFIVVTPAGNFPEFLPFAYTIENGNLHIFANRFINGQTIPGTRQVTLGEKKLGEFILGQYGSMPVNIIVKEL